MTMKTTDANYMGMSDVCADLARGHCTIRRYMKTEGLPYSYRNGHLVVKRADLDEWKSRPEIKAMLQVGDHIKRGGAVRLAKAV